MNDTDIELPDRDDAAAQERTIEAHGEPEGFCPACGQPLDGIAPVAI
jgi:hypothetical protein